MDKSNGLYCDSGVFGIPGYAFKVIYDEVKSTQGPTGAQNDLIETQMVQGFREWEAASQEERNLIFLRVKSEI